ncbi:MAG TPA: PrsW family glutamic-type intramembrane protease [Ktedonobacteraceae bacterium]|nr:PrsW family glutamic-type intramembrane protease [Ktedonobacteraceae bacterium]
MNEQYGALRVVRMLPDSRLSASAAQERSGGGWLPAEGLVHVLTRRDTTIGRALNNDIILLDLTVSREHARLLFGPHGWQIVNLTEQNVVRVNGRPVPSGGSLPVYPQDILILGNTMLQLIAPQNPPAFSCAHEDSRQQAGGTQGTTSSFSGETISQLDGSKGHQTTRASTRTPEKLSERARQEIAAFSPTPLPGVEDGRHWDEEEPESVLGPGITMQFVLPQRMGPRARWLIAGIGIAILIISAMITIILNSLIGFAALEQNGANSILLALTIPIIPAVGIFLLVNFMDRYEREPWFLRLAAFLWGALIAIPPALFIETQVNNLIGTWLANGTNSAVFQALYKGLNAGVTEETVKGLGLLLLFIVLRDQFDNVTDGIIYGALIGAGFAMVENFGYFASNGQNFLGLLIIGRIVLGWLGHSTFTACFGAALGYTRHNHSRWKQISIPLLGYLLAIGLHSFFDFIDLQASEVIRTSVANGTTINYALAAIIGNYIPPFLAQMALLYILIKSLSHEAAVIREFLAVEVSNGIVLVDEYALLQNSFQRTKRERQVLRTQGFRQWLRVKALYQTEIGLAFRKWHVSMGDKPKSGYRQPEDAYRERIRHLRHEIQMASTRPPSSQI